MSTARFSGWGGVCPTPRRQNQTLPGSRFAVGRPPEADPRPREQNDGHASKQYLAPNFVFGR